MAHRPHVTLALLALVFSGCAANGGGTMGPQPPPATRARPGSGSASNYIKNVFVIIQENRSFENFFAGWPGANAPTSGCALPSSSGSARRVSSSAARLRGSSSGSGCPPGDVQIPLHQVTLQHSPGLKHDWESSIGDWDSGNMDGFGANEGLPGKYEAYAYVKQSQLQPYYTMAQQYVLADEMFPTEYGGSFTAHLTLVAGTDDIGSGSLLPTKAEVNYPNGAYDDCDSPPGTLSSYVSESPYRQLHLFKGPFPCFNQFNTMAEVLDSAGVSWRFYATKLLDAGFWEPYEAIKYVRYGGDWKTDISAPQTNFFGDVQYGRLASVSWITPTKKDSDHPGNHSDTGPSWVASLVNAIGESSYWSSSAIIILWDDWGGFYDNAAPPQLDYRGLGIRVPCLIISPYAKQGYVDSTQYEYGSILRFIEEVYGLPAGSIGPTSEGYTDGRATSLDDAFDFAAQPRQFEKIPSKYPAPYFVHEPPSNEPVDTQ
jgi:phospholipase C